MVDHYNVIITLTLVLSMVSLLTMAETQSSIEDVRSYIGIPLSVHNNKLPPNFVRFIRRMTSDNERDGPLPRQLVDFALRRMNDLKMLNQFDNQRANLEALLAGRGLNNWKREGAETYKNMFLGVRG